MGVAEILRKCKSHLESRYRDRFRGLILYGSMARQQADATSDVDLLVLLDQPFDYFQEVSAIIELLYPVQLESERLISVKPALVDDFERGTIQLYRNIKREGVLV